MTQVDLLTWEGYAIYRALLGEPIPSPTVWDNARLHGWKGGNYIKDRYFEIDIFTQVVTSSKFEQSLTRVSPKSDQFVIPKSDGSLGMTGAVTSLFSSKPVSAAYFRVYLEDVVQKRATRPPLGLSVEQFCKEAKSLIQRLRVALNTSEIDLGYHHGLNCLDVSNNYPVGTRKWQRVSRQIDKGVQVDGQVSIESIAGMIVAEFDTQKFGYGCLGELLSEQSKSSELLGSQYWLPLMYSHCLNPIIYFQIRSELASRKKSVMETHKILMPAYFPNITEYKVVEWLKKTGDKVIRGESVAVVETNRADIDVESLFDGYLHTVLIPTGGTVTVGEALGLIVESQAAVSESTMTECDLKPGKDLTVNTDVAVEIASKMRPEEQNSSTTLDLTIPEGVFYENIFQICDITGKSFAEVSAAAKALGCKSPFTLAMADRIAHMLCGVSSIKRLYELRIQARNKSLSSLNRAEPQTGEGTTGSSSIATTTTSRLTNNSGVTSGNRQIQVSVASDYRKVPVFSPSEAPIPTGFREMSNEKLELEYALQNPEIGFRSFFNDLPLLENNSWIEHTLFIPAFNERLYAQLVIEYHRYSISQLRTQKAEVIKQAERKGAGVGALIGLITSGGIMAPFMAMMGANISKMGVNNVDPSKPIEEYLPDPSLLFMRDEGSFSSLREAYQSASVKRRVCMRRIEKGEGIIYWDVFPMILLDRQAIPAQVFKWEDSYFLRPVTAGLTEKDIPALSYNPFKMRRSLSYHPAHDIHTPVEAMTTSILGPTIEKQPVIFKTGLKEDKSFPHYYFDYPKESQVF